MKVYIDLVKDVLENGVPSDDRTGTGTLSVFGRQIRFDLTKGFPLLTTKKMHFKGILYELLWMLRGETNISFLVKNGINIWNDDAYRYFQQVFTENNEIVSEYSIKSSIYSLTEYNKERFIQDVINFNSEKTRLLRKNHIDGSYDFFDYCFGDLGKIYGHQWRGIDYGDQISRVINEIKTNPTSRRLIVDSWDSQSINKGDVGLPPCHFAFQFYVRNNKLSCMCYQRSADLMLGVPYNIAFYSLLTKMVAKECNLELGEVIFSFGDLHIYNNHIDGAREQVTRECLELSEVELNYDKWLFEIIHNYQDEYIVLKDYKSNSKINFELSVGK